MAAAISHPFRPLANFGVTINGKRYLHKHTLPVDDHCLYGLGPGVGQRFKKRPADFYVGTIVVNFFGAQSSAQDNSDNERNQSTPATKDPNSLIHIHECKQENPPAN